MNLTLSDLPFLGVSRTPFSPSDVTGMQFWFKADSLSLNNNDPVSRWNDSGPRAAYATQSSATLQPLYKTNVINGKPVVRFDGSNDYLLLNSASFSGMSVFVVGNPSGSGLYLSYPPIDMHKNAGDNDYNSADAFFFQVPSALSSTAIQFYSQGGKYSDTSAISLTSPTLITATVKYVDATHGDAGMRKNGVSIMSQANAGISPTLNPLSGTIGSRLQPGPSGTYLFGDVAELIVYNSYVGDMARDQIESYLNTKYAIY